MTEKDEKATELIRISPTVKKKLNRIGMKTDSYNDIVKRALEEYEKKEI